MPSKSPRPWLLLAITALGSSAEAQRVGGEAIPWDQQPVVVGPVQGDLERATAASRAELARCRADLTPAQRARLSLVRRALLPLAGGNRVRGLHFDPPDSSLDAFRACLWATVSRWDLGRPETALYAVVALTGPELRLLLSP